MARAKKQETDEEVMVAEASASIIEFADEAEEKVEAEKEEPKLPEEAPKEVYYLESDNKYLYIAELKLQFIDGLCEVTDKVIYEKAKCYYSVK